MFNFGFLVAFLCFLGAILPLEGEAAELVLVEDQAYSPDAGEPIFVTPPDLPTKVAVGLVVLHINRISPPSEPFPTAEFEGLLLMEWRDPRLAFDPETTHVRSEVFMEHDAELKLEEIWWPAPVIQNEIHKRQTEDLELEILPNGDVRYTERFSATIPLNFDFRRFPFDRQVLQIELESFEWDRRQLVLEALATKLGLGREARLPGWRISGFDAGVLDVEEARGDRAFSKLRVDISVDRNYWIHVKTTVIPMILILFVLTFVVYSNVESRISYILISLLAFVGLNGLIAKELPGLSQFTFLDYLILIGYAASLLALVEAVTVQKMIKAGREDWAFFLEHLNQRALPSLLVIAILLSLLVYA